MSINNREDANKYYQLINELVDEYIDKWKIRPSRLGKYLRPGSDRFNKFLMRNNLSEVKGAEVILKDIIEDRVHMEKDGVMTFESFHLFESDDFKIDSMKECLYKGIEKADIKMEKILADVFDTNLGSIDIVDADKHIFKIEDWEGEDKKVIIYSSDDDLLTIKENIMNHLYEDISKRKIELTDKISIDLNNLIDENDFEDYIDETFGLPGYFPNKKFLDIITDLLTDYKYFKEFTDSDIYHIWIS